MEQIRYTLEVEGSMYEANYFELTERQYQDLKAKGERSKTWKKNLVRRLYIILKRQYLTKDL